MKERSRFNQFSFFFWGKLRPVFGCSIFVCAQRLQEQSRSRRFQQLLCRNDQELTSGGMCFLHSESLWFGDYFCFAKALLGDACVYLSTQLWIYVEYFPHRLSKRLLCRAHRSSVLQLFDGEYFWHKNLLSPVHALAVGCSVLGREVSVVFLSSALIIEPFLSHDGGVEQVLQSRNVIFCVPRPFLQSQPPHLSLLCVKGKFYVFYFPTLTHPYLLCVKDSGWILCTLFSNMDRSMSCSILIFLEFLIPSVPVLVIVLYGCKASQNLPPRFVPGSSNLKTNPGECRRSETNQRLPLNE